MQNVLENVAGPARDMVVLNAGAAVHPAAVSSSLEAEVALTDQCIARGAASGKLVELVGFTGG